MLFNLLPSDILQHIYEYDTTYREYIQKVVLVELMTVLKEHIYNSIDLIGNDYRKVYAFLTSDSINPHLLKYDTKFHAIDQKFFNYYFMKRIWTS